MSLSRVIQDILSHLVCLLVDLYTSSREIGRFDPSWKAYQAEIALEEIVHGQPLSEGYFQLSVSLRTSSVGQFSLSYQWGSIVLAPHNVVSAGETPPSLFSWTKYFLQEERILRLFPLYQSLDAAPFIAGTMNGSPAQHF